MVPPTAARDESMPTQLETMLGVDEDFGKLFSLCVQQEKPTWYECGNR